MKSFVYRIFSIIIIIVMILSIYKIDVFAAEIPDKNEREQFYRAIENIIGVPWYIVAAYCQYELKTQKVSNEDILIRSHLHLWSGIGNPEAGEKFPYINALYDGIGRDGNGDGIADKNNFYDNIYSFALWLSQQGHSEMNYVDSIRKLYNNDKAILRILQFTKIYNHFNTIEISGNAFPIPKNYSYSYRSTWGAGRSFGGYRIHEGTDIFAKAWTPVRSTTNGIVEIKGWNRFGGWRIGIRDIDNVYHYYAHLAGYAKELQEGDIVKAGQVIGYVGSSGYGAEGTTGKFPPHLHYGMYKDTGTNEWAFDPTPSLYRWEKADKLKKR